MITINLPVGTIHTIVNLDDKRVEIPIEQAYEIMKKDPDKYIRSMDTSFDIVNKEINGKDLKMVEFQHEISFINKMRVLPIINNKVIYFNVTIRYDNGEEKDVIVPSYVKFFSKTLKQFIPIEFISKSDMLVDYRGYFAQVRNCKEATDFTPTEFYNMYMNSPNDIQMTFYYDGILSYVCYNNFQKKEVTNE